MNWLPSIFIGLLTGVVGCFGGDFVATLCVRWYRISGFEGGSGYFVVFMGLFGAIVGLIAGIVCARVVAAGASPGFLKALGLAVGSMAGLLLVIGVISRLAADLPPAIDGRKLELAIEVKGPVGFTMPVVVDENQPTARVSLARGRTQPGGIMRLKEAVQVDGRWIIPGTVPLQTSASDKHLHAYINDEHNLVFWLPLPGHPKKKHQEWSQWVEAGWTPGTPKPVPDANFHLRTRVMLVEPPPLEPPAPTQKEIDAQKAASEEAGFQAFPADAPLKDWLRYAEYGTPPERLQKAVPSMTARPKFVEELSGLILGVDPKGVRDALRLLEHVQPVPKGLVEPVKEFGQHIARSLQRLNGTSSEPPFGGETDMSQWFSAWMVALIAVQGKDGVDLTPELHEILKEARKCKKSGEIQLHVTRVASYYMKEWAGVEPLPTDPKPQG